MSIWCKSIAHALVRHRRSIIGLEPLTDRRALVGVLVLGDDGVDDQLARNRTGDRLDGGLLSLEGMRRPSAAPRRRASCGAAWCLLLGLWRLYARRSCESSDAPQERSAVGDAGLPMRFLGAQRVLAVDRPPICQNSIAVPKRVFRDVQNLHTHIPHLSKNSGKSVVREQKPVRVRQLQHLSLDDREAQLDRLPGAAAYGPLII